MDTALMSAAKTDGAGAGIRAETARYSSGPPCITNTEQASAGVSVDIAPETAHPMTDRLLAVSQEIWEGYHSHPFVRGIADGSLDPHKFEYYMLQDYVYLFDYARVFAIGAAKSKDPEVMGYNAAMLRQIMGSEMEIHRGYMKRLGISEEAAARTVPALDNLSYTSYMIRVAYEEGPAETAAAILACALSYEVIAKRILEAFPDADKHPFYGEWVQGYASPEYHAANVDCIRLMEKLAESCTEAQKRHLEEIFLICARYEAAFWDMAWERRK